MELISGPSGEAWCDRYALLGSNPIVLGIVGVQKEVRGVVRDFLAGRDVFLNGRRLARMKKERYQVNWTYDGNLAYAVISDREQWERPTGALVPESPEAVAKILDELGIPYVPEWLPVIGSALRSYGGWKRLTCSGWPRNPTWIEMTAPKLLRIIRYNLGNGAIAIPDSGGISAGEFGSLAEYMASWAPELARRVEERFVPSRRPGDPLPQKLLGLELFPAQADVVAAIAETLERRRSALLVGEMGTGKTRMSAAVPYVREKGSYRALIMAPGHLVKKWTREIEAFVPRAQVSVLRSFRDAERLREKPAGREYVIVSRDRVKLGGTWRPAVVRVRRPSGDFFRCPDCGAVLEHPAKEKDELPEPWTEQDLRHRNSRNSKCPRCGASLWQLTKEGGRGLDLATFLHKRKARIDYLLVDEVHEEKGETAQGEAMGKLAALARKSLAATGTLLGGYASDLFRILFRLDPDGVKARGFGANSLVRFVRAYGAEQSVRAVRKNGEKTLSVREKPGVNPRLYADFLAHSSVFIDLDDLAEHLPPYEERVVLCEMAPAQAEGYKALESGLKAWIEGAVKGSSRGRRLGQYVQELLAWPDAPWEERELEDETGEKFAVPKVEMSDLPDPLLPKEKELLEAVREEKDKGRRTAVFTVFTGERDERPRLAEILRQAGFSVAILDASVPQEEREAWLKRQKADVLLTHPRLVGTGLDLYEYPSIIWWSTGYSVYLLRQASRRSLRIGQTQPVIVRFLAYAETVQEKALELMASKLVASLAIEGRFSDEGLRALGESSDVLTELARAVVGEIDLPGLEGAWKVYKGARVLKTVREFGRKRMPKGMEQLALF